MRHGQHGWMAWHGGIHACGQAGKPCPIPLPPNLQHAPSAVLIFPFCPFLTRTQALPLEGSCD